MTTIIRSSAFFLIVLMPFIASANIVYEYDAVISIYTKSGSSALERIVDNAQRNNDQQADAENQVYLINANLIYKNGYEISYPGKFYVEYNINGEVKSYRFEYVEPVLNLFDPTFDPQDPSIQMETRKIIIVDIPREKKVIISEGLDGSAKKTEENIHINTKSPAEEWIYTFNHYKDFEKLNLKLKMTLGATQIFEWENAAGKTINVRKEDNKISLSMDSGENSLLLSESFTISDDNKYLKNFSRSTKDTDISVLLTNQTILTESDSQNIMSFPEN